MGVIQGNVRSGEPLRIAAATFNAILDVTRKAQPGGGASARAVRFARVTSPHPFKVTPGGGLNVRVADGDCYGVTSLLHEEIWAIRPPLNLDEFSERYANYGRIQAGTYTLAPSAYSVLAIKAPYLWMQMGSFRTSYVTGNGDDSVVVESSVLAQLSNDPNADGFEIVKDTIDATAWTSQTEILPTVLRNTLTTDPAITSFLTRHFYHFPVAVVETDEDSVVDITQILRRNLQDTFSGSVMLVPLDTFEV